MDANFGALEILALILIALVFIKVIILAVSPKSWLDGVRKVYVKPAVTSTIALILAGVVLYFLLQAGITVVDILAVTVFIALFAMVGMAKYAGPLMNFFEAEGLGTLWKDFWFYTLLWLVLLGWGVKEIFFT
ncbi:MAG: hypothetical protein MJA83_14055 [Gammaproteobacteria bacterium]|nr:hypothetical protein [Gammaproteobacteria bacterium]